MKRLVILFAAITTTAPALSENLLYIKKPIAHEYTADSRAMADLLAPYGLTSVEDYGPHAYATAPATIDTAALSKAVGMNVSVLADGFTLDLAELKVDTRKGLPVLGSDLELADYAEGGPGLYLIQFRAPIRGEWLDQLRKEGIRPIQFVNSNGYIVSAPAGISALRKRLPAAVRFSATLPPGLKVPQTLRARSALADRLVEPVTILVDRITAPSDFLLRLRLQDPAAEIADAGAATFRAKLTTNAPGWRALARSPAVLWIEPTYTATLSDERANQIAAHHYGPDLLPYAPQEYKTWLSGFAGLSDLSTEVIDIQDSGIQTSLLSQSACLFRPNLPGGHRDLNGPGHENRLEYACARCGLQTSNDGYYHGTFVAGLIAGDPTQVQGGPPPDANDPNLFYWGMGLAPGVRFGVTRIFADNGWMCADPDLTQNVSEAYGFGARYQNNSWNSTSIGYTMQSQEYDSLVRDATGTSSGYGSPMTVVFSAGNWNQTGDMSVQAPATAKNVITVGASGLPRAGLGGVCDTEISIRDIPSLSRRGVSGSWNTYKPDLLAPGRSLTSARALNSTGIDCSGSTATLPTTPNGPYYPGDGTSFSAPQVSAAAIIVKKTIEQIQGPVVSPALIKAALIGTAEQMAGGWDFAAGYSVGYSPLQNVGYGRLSLEKLLTDPTPKFYLDEDHGVPATRRFLSAGTYKNFTYTVADPTKPVIGALVFTDAPGDPGSGVYRVNELDMYVLQGGFVYCDGQIYQGFSTRSTSCWLPDFYNTAKRFVIPPNSFSGSFTIQLVAQNVSAEAVPGLDNAPNQDWALFLYNAY